MKVTLVIVLAVLTCSALIAAPRTQSPQHSAPVPEAPPLATGQASQQQPGAPPTSQPCAESKDTCEVAPEQQTATPGPQLEQKQEPKPASKPATHKRKKPHRHKSIKTQETVASQDPNLPKKIVVRHGGTSDPTTVLTPGATARGSYSPQLTADLLSATDANLKEANTRPLTAAQEQTVNQIKMFMEQANAAVKAGDLDRGHNLAMKAHLLSDDLVKH